MSSLPLSSGTHRLVVLLSGIVYDRSRRFRVFFDAVDFVPCDLRRDLETMKNEIHPEYRDVVFFDVAADAKFLTRSTMSSKETIEFEGQEYPLVKVDISSASHPFYTGKMKYVDSAGRVEKFQKKYGWDKRRQKAKEAEAETAGAASEEVASEEAAE
jgi:large subunit ribosomal protein L31